MRLHGECKIAGKATVLSVTSRTEETGPPLPYNLAELQKDANRRYGLTAGQVHDIAQSLYEKKLITYPRTSGRHIPGDVLATLPRIIGKVSVWKELGAYLKSVGVDVMNIEHRQAPSLRHRRRTPRHTCDRHIPRRSRQGRDAGVLDSVRAYA